MPKLIERAKRLLAMSQAAIGHREECEMIGAGQALLPDPLLHSTDRCAESTCAVQLRCVACGCVFLEDARRPAGWFFARAYLTTVREPCSLIGSDVDGEHLRTICEVPPRDWMAGSGHHGFRKAGDVLMQGV
jgi:hypothetical protein